MVTQPKWPKSGDRVIFTGCPKFYFPHFINMRTFCDAKLILGQTYIIHDAQVHSSWVSLTLEGFKKETLNWGFFKFA